MKFSTDKVLAGAAVVLAILALVGVGASGTMLALGVIALGVREFI